MMSPFGHADDDQGFSLAELNVASLVGAIIIAAVMAFLVSVTRDSGYIDNRVTTQADVQFAMDRLAVELREAERVGSQRAVTDLSATTITFTSDAHSDTGVETLTYALYPAGCTSGCTLRRTLVTTSAITQTMDMVRDVAANGVGFVGVSYDGTGTRTEVTACDDATPCIFDGVEITLTVDIVNGTAPQQYRETVSLRNGT